MKAVLADWAKRSGRKPRVLILADVPGWAYDINARGLCKALADDFDMEIAYLHHGESPDPRQDYFDLYHVCCWVDIITHWHIHPDRVVKEVSSHRWEEEAPWGPLTPGQFCEKYLADAGVVTATSKRLQSIVASIRPVLLVPNGVRDLFCPGTERAGSLTFGWAGNAEDPCKGLRDILIPAAYNIAPLNIAPGNVPHEDMRAFYQGLDVICVASTREGEPLPLLEAMRCGCFPICTDVGIVPELVRHGGNGLIVERTPEAFRRAFHWCLEHPELVRAAGRKNSTLIQETRSWDRVKGAWRRAWCEALKRCGPVAQPGPLASSHAKEMLPASALPNAFRHNLEPGEWHKAIVGTTSAHALAERIQTGDYPEWVSAVLQATHPGDVCLELGSGSGALSAVLAQQGRKTVLLDFSEESLEFSRNVFRHLNISGEFFNANVLQKFNFADNIFDCVWSSGLLEHFSDDTIQHIISESARVSKNSVVSLVPNAASIPYRLGKWHQEATGKWIYGYEDPKYTLAMFYERAGLHHVHEYSIAWRQALQFMRFPDGDRVRGVIEKWYDTLEETELTKLNQGYLLVTVGSIDNVKLSYGKG